jgi:WD40 repeat protein
MTSRPLHLLLALLPLPALAAEPELAKDQFVHAIAFSPDGKRFAATQCPDAFKPAPSTVAVFDTQSWKRTQLLDGLKGSPRGLAFVPGTTDLVAAGSDGTVLIWDAATGKLQRTIDTKAPNISHLAVSPTGKQFAVVHQPKSVLSQWDPVTGEKIRQLDSTEAIFARSGALTYSPDGKRLAVAYMGTQTRPAEGGLVREWDVETGKEAARYDSPAGGLLSVAISPDGKWLAAGMRSGYLPPDQEKRRGDLYVWDRTTGKLAHTLDGDTPDMVLFLAFSPDSKTLYAATKGRATTPRPNGSGTSSQLHAWDAAAGQRLWIREGKGSSPTGLAVGPSSAGLIDLNGLQILDR